MNTITNTVGMYLESLPSSDVFAFGLIVGISVLALMFLSSDMINGGYTNGHTSSN